MYIICTCNKWDNFPELLFVKYQRVFDVFKVCWTYFGRNTIAEVFLGHSFDQTCAIGCFGLQVIQGIPKSTDDGWSDMNWIHHLFISCGLCKSICPIRGSHVISNSPFHFWLMPRCSSLIVPGVLPCFTIPWLAVKCDWDILRPIYYAAEIIIFVWSTIPFLALKICFFSIQQKHKTHISLAETPFFVGPSLPFLAIQSPRIIVVWPEAGYARSGSGCTFKWSRQFAGPLNADGRWLMNLQKFR